MKRRINKSIIIPFAMIIICIMASFYGYIGNYCAMDGLKSVLEGKSLSAIAMVIILYYNLINKNTYWVSAVVLHKNKRIFAKKQIYNILTLSLIFTIFTVIVSLIIGCANSSEHLFFNWTSKDSVYALLNGDDGFNNDIFMMIIEGGLAIYLFIFDALIFLLLGYWIMDSYLLPMIVSVIIVTSDIVKSPISLFYRRFSIIDEMWKNPYGKTLMNLFILFLIGALFVAVILIMAERKEFIGESKMSE